jgi:hypothetical protein
MTAPATLMPIEPDRSRATCVMGIAIPPTAHKTKAIARNDPTMALPRAA